VVGHEGLNDHPEIHATFSLPHSHSDSRNAWTDGFKMFDFGAKVVGFGCPGTGGSIGLCRVHARFWGSWNGLWHVHCPEDPQWQLGHQRRLFWHLGDVGSRVHVVPTRKHDCSQINARAYEHIHTHMHMHTARRVHIAIVCFFRKS